MAENYAQNWYQVCMFPESPGVFCEECEAINYVVFRSILSPPQLLLLLMMMLCWLLSSLSRSAWGKCSAGVPP